MQTIRFQAQKTNPVMKTVSTPMMTHPTPTTTTPTTETTPPPRMIQMTIQIPKALAKNVEYVAQKTINVSIVQIQIAKVASIVLTWLDMVDLEH